MVFLSVFILKVLLKKLINSDGIALIFSTILKLLKNCLIPNKNSLINSKPESTNEITEFLRLYYPEIPAYELLKLNNQTLRFDTIKKHNLN